MVAAALLACWSQLWHGHRLYQTQLIQEVSWLQVGWHHGLRHRQFLQQHTGLAQCSHPSPYCAE